MGAISFSIDREAVKLLARTLGLTCFMETGTFRGDSLALVRDLFPRLYSAEIDETLAREATGRFRDDERIVVRRGPSPGVLRDLLADPQAGLDDGVLFWLDAHWCKSAGTDITGQCPLLEELAAIGRLGGRSVIAIDDARLFLAPPTADHVILDWPSFDAILRSVREIAPTHRVLVLNDVIWVLPPPAVDAFTAYAAQAGADWLSIAEKGRTYDAVLAQLQDKDREIANLLTAAQQRLDAMLQMEGDLRQANAALRAQAGHVASLELVAVQANQAKDQLNSLQSELAIREHLLQRLDADLRTANADRMAQASRMATLEASAAEALEARNRAEDTRRQRDTELAEAAALAAAATSQAEQASAQLAAMEAIAKERAELIARLDANARQAAERAAIAEDACRHREAQTAEASALAAEAALKADQAQAQIAALEAVARERGDLIARLDAAARESATQASTTQAALDHLRQEAAVLHAAAADLAAQAQASTDRANELERVAAERGALIERLDGMARAVGLRAETLDELVRTQAIALAESQGRAAAAEAQLMELSAGAAEAAARAQAAEQERDARQTVIDELVRNRDALSAALTARPQPTWLGRLLFRNPA